MRRRHRRRWVASLEAFDGINITPFTDVLLVLLIIFMIAGSSLVPSGLGLSGLATPQGSTATSQDLNVLLLEIDRDGTTRLSLAGDRLVWSDLESLPRGTRVTLLIHPDTPAEGVVRGYDRLLEAGLRDIEWGPPANSSDEI